MGKRMEDRFTAVIYILGMLVGVSLGLLLGVLLKWVNGSSSAVFIGFVLGAVIFGPLIARLLMDRLGRKERL